MVLKRQGKRGGNQVIREEKEIIKWMLWKRIFVARVYRNDVTDKRMRVRPGMRWAGEVERERKKNWSNLSLGRKMWRDNEEYAVCDDPLISEGHQRNSLTDSYLNLSHATESLPCKSEWDTCACFCTADKADMHWAIKKWVLQVRFQNLAHITAHELHIQSSHKVYWHPKIIFP